MPSKELIYGVRRLLTYVLCTITSVVGDNDYFTVHAAHSQPYGGLLKKGLTGKSVLRLDLFFKPEFLIFFAA